MASKKSGRILVVEDEKDIAVLTVFRLESAGFKTTLVADGLAALESVQSEKPDLVLLDIDIPKIRGDEVCARIKADKRFADVKVVFLSASAVSIAEDAKIFGADDHLAKPYEGEVLIDLIRRNLKKTSRKSAGLKKV